jgi:hypothetical protein
MLGLHLALGLLHPRATRWPCAGAQRQHLPEQLAQRLLVTRPKASDRRMIRHLVRRAPLTVVQRMRRDLRQRRAYQRAADHVTGIVHSGVHARVGD